MLWIDYSINIHGLFFFPLLFLFYADQTYQWADVAAFVAGCFAVMVLLIGVGFFLNEMVCRQYFKEPAAEYYAMRGDLPNVNSENTRL